MGCANNGLVISDGLWYVMGEPDSGYRRSEGRSTQRTATALTKHCRHCYFPSLTLRLLIVLTTNFLGHCLILSASTAWLFPSTSTAWRYLRGLTPIAIPGATLWHPVTREHASHRVNQTHCPISSALKLESAPEISRLHLTCAAGVTPAPLVFLFVLFTTNNSTPVNRKRCCSRHTRPNRPPSFAYSTLATV